MSVAIHIGIAKTGTTWLQSRYFSRLPGYHYSRADEVLSALIRNLIIEPDERFAERALHAHVEQLNERLETNLLVSEEALSGYLFDGGRNRGRIVDRLHGAFAGASILAVVREQGSLLRSLYVQYVADGGHRSFRSFCLGDDVEGVASPLKFAEFDELIDLYRRTFGPERVTVLPYERFRTNPEAFLADVGRFLGIGEAGAPASDAADATNVSMSGLSRRVLRSVNRSFCRSEFNSHPTVADLEVATVVRPVLQAVLDRRLLVKASRRLDADDEALVSELRQGFAASNTRLQTMMDDSLADLGYVLA